MPKLSKTRIINLNYNDGKRTIYNELFDYGDGKNTLFSMENGIGKTVLIQFFLQPFIRNKRDLAGRKFEEYFTGTAPAYILHEVLLDNGEKLLVGMIIKKDNSEDEKNKIKILAFTNKYSKPNDFDIVNIPFVEGKRILKFSEAEDKIKKYKSGKVNFKYYNFNDSSKKAIYFEDLRAYKINYKEWEDIIRIINNDESGLSNLYDKHKTDEALIRNVIIPLIESKINGEKNVIEGIRTNLGKYVESYKQSKESFHEVEILKAFQGEMIPVTEFLEQGAVMESSKTDLFKKLSYIANLCEKEFSGKISEKLQCEEFINELKSELARVDYEEHSLKYYKLKDREEELQKKLNEITETHNNNELKYKFLVKEKYIQESAEIYEELIIKEKDLAKVRERIANFEREDSEIALNIRNYKYTLKEIYQQELQESLEKEAFLLENTADLKIKISENQKKQNEVDLERIKLIKEEANINNKIKDFEKNEEKFKRKYKDFNLLKNPLLNQYSDKELEKYGLGVEEKIKSSIALEKNLISEVEAITSEIENFKKETDNALNNLTKEKINLEKKKDELDNFNVETGKILEILRIKNLPLNVSQYKIKLKEQLQSENNKFQENIEREQVKVRELEETINRYETGLIKLPKEVLESFDNKGINFEYGLNWLQNYKGSKQEKENLVKNNPFFPYGIILNSKDINLLKNESIDVYTSIPIPILDRSALNKTLNVGKNNDILTVENQEFLVAFNYLLIDEEEKAELLRTLNQEIKILKEDIKNLEAAIYRNKEYEIVLSNYKFAGNENDTLEKDINKLITAINELEESINNYKKLVTKNERKKEANSKELHDLEKKLMVSKEHKENFNQFIIELDEFKISNDKFFEVRRYMDAIEKKIRTLKENSNELQKELNTINNLYNELKNTIKNISAQIELYKSIEKGIIVQGDKNIIKGKLEACEKNLGENIKRDKEDEKRLIYEIEKDKRKLSRMSEEGNLSKEYEKVTFREQYLKEIKNKINSLSVELDELKKQMNTLDKEISLAISKKTREVQDIENLGFQAPIAKEEIKDLNFRNRKNKIKEDLKENNQIINEYTDEIEKLKLIKHKLDFYKSSSTEKVEDVFDFSNIEEAAKSIEEYIKKYEEIITQLYNLESKITKEINFIYEKYRDNNRFIKERLFDYLNKERKILRHSDIDSLLEVVDRRVRTLELELSSIMSEEEVVINEILRYANHLLEEIRTIDKRSNIKHLGKTQKLLEINIPEEKDEEALREYIKGKVIYYGSVEEDYAKLIESDIQSGELLSKLIGNINRIHVYIKKIEKTGLVRKMWKDALSQNSGGEKFVSMFILLSSLMSYMRKRDTDIDKKEDKKILIMDNPFAKTNAEHLLEPMFQIAEKYNMQLLCFSGIGGSAVYNRFNKIYAAKVVVDKYRNKENVSFTASTEETLELTDFTITKEQISLF